jgi:predicted MFS family arabinose efflux permease
MAFDRQKLAVVIPLGITQTIAWASSYYLPAILARPIAADLDVPPSVIYGALTFALVIAGLLGPRVGHAIDRLGGRELLCMSNLVFVAGLVILGAAHGLVTLAIAWLFLGIGMGLGLYEAAFATLTRFYGTEARSAITGITLIAGFASTVGWPITTLIDAHYGWRSACLFWALVHVLLALPLNFWLPRLSASHALGAATDVAGLPDKATETRAMILIAYVFAATGFVSVGLSAMLPALMQQLGATPAAALLSATLVGPAQVLARIIEASLLRRMHPLTSTRLATVMHPIGAALIAVGGPIIAPAFTILYGAGNGILTIARGTLPLAVFGPVGFGRRVGVLAVPARVSGAIAPLVLGLLMQSFGANVLWISAALSISACAALYLMRLKV